jgi:tetratricopeptide (TPR) repeat protein
MIKKRITAVLVVVLLAVGGTVVLKYYVPEGSAHPTPDAGIARSHPPAAATAPSKDNVNRALKEKIDHLRQVIENDTGNSAIAFEVARLLQDSHNPRDAVQYYARGLMSDSKNSDARIDYSLCLYEVGREAEALRQCMIVLQSDSTHAEALFNLGAIYANEAIRDSAKAYWTKLVAKHPTHRLATKARENLRMLAGKSTSL